MEKEEIRKNAEHELQWLKYYATAESRKLLVPTKPIYDQLVSASPGTSARNIPLKMRCSSMRISSDEKITIDTLLDKLHISDQPNAMSALEVYVIKYPEDHTWVTNSLQ